MDNVWQGSGDSTQELNYTEGIDLTQCFVQTGEQVHHEFNNEGTYTQPNTLSGPRKKGAPSRSKNFSGVEDETLCSAYLNVSKDPVVGVNQSMKAYWDRITEYYNESRKTSNSRTKSSLQHRWGEIQKDTTRFCGFYAEIVRKNQSGKSEDDKMKDALQLYEGVVKSPFRFLHCWFIMRNEQKWNDHLANLSCTKADPPPAKDIPVQATEDTDPTKFARPIGRDRAKKQRSSSSSSNSTACYEMLQKIQFDRAKFEERVEATSKEESKDVAARNERKLQLQEQQLKIQQDNNLIQKEMLTLQQKEREDRVMTLDLDKMSPWVREYYINQQKEIAERTKNSGTM